MCSSCIFGYLYIVPYLKCNTHPEEKSWRIFVRLSSFSITCLNSKICCCLFVYSPFSMFYFQVIMNPTNSTNPFSSSVKTNKWSATIPKQKTKMMISNHGLTINGALKIQQMLECKFVNGSDSMLHSALLPFKGVYFTYTTQKKCS